MNKSLMVFALLTQSCLCKNAITAWTCVRTRVLATGKRPFHRGSSYLRESSSIDEYGRRIRRKPDDNDEDGRDGGNEWIVTSSPRNENAPTRRRPENNRESQDGSWSDFDPFDNNDNYNNNSQRRTFAASQQQQQQPSQRPPYQEKTRERSRFQREERSRFPRGDSKPPQFHRDRRPNRSFNDDNFSGMDRLRRNRFMTEESPERKINMRALEGAGFVHLYGLSSTLNALQANRRNFRRPEDEDIDLESLDGEAYEHELQQRERKATAQFAPWLFLQTRKGEFSSSRTSSKTAQADRVMQLAQQRGVPIAHVDKGVLNALSYNRPHQGYVLRCGGIEFESIARLPSPSEDEKENKPGQKQLWLALDEIVDPQNLGALLRSAYFLGGGGGGSGSGGDSAVVKVLVCAKNSAPPSPVVSASSAGALEIMTIYSTNNLHKTLAAAELDGYRIIGAESNVPANLQDIPVFNLQDIPPLDPKQPTVLVLGSEGHGIRNLVATACTEFVRIPASCGTPENNGAGYDGVAGVDSLNVSVTGGILLWHLLNAK